jgi:hypothetical protein
MPILTGFAAPLELTRLAAPFPYERINRHFPLNGIYLFLNHVDVRSSIFSKLLEFWFF